jgi:molybdopterin converting factor small subunit
MAQVANVRFFGRLHSLRQGRGLPAEAEVEVPTEGVTADALARKLGLPLEEIEAVFCNHRTYDLAHVILPGDAVAFVPQGTPGPHRFTLGIYSAGRRSGGDDDAR